MQDGRHNDEQDDGLSYLKQDEMGVFYDTSPYVIGIMSGTSLDAIDAVLCRFDESIEVVATLSQDFDDNLRVLLLSLCCPDGIKDFVANESVDGIYGKMPQRFVSELDAFGFASRAYGECASVLVNDLLKKAGVDASTILAIGCHGQTVRHRPQWGFSLQLLDPNVLAERTGIAVVSDFRRRDMAVGGQGAPLVPAFHSAVFGASGATAVLNLGGIANVTILAESITGFDTGVANLLMDGWCARHTGQAFDAEGAWAKTGHIHQNLLNQLLKHPFLAQSPPKSTGREDFNMTWLDAQLAHFESITPADVQATLVEFTAVAVASALKQACKTQGLLYVCGGGAYNDYLMARLQANLADWRILSTQSLGIEPHWVEAIAFGWLARQNLLGAYGNIPSVTGAKKAVVLGQICFG